MTLDASTLQVVKTQDRRLRRASRSTVASIGLHAALIVASLIAVFPVFWVLVTSFKPDAKAVEPTPKLFNESSLDNYTRILAGDKGSFLTWFGNSAVVAGLTMLLGVFMASTAAYALSRFRFPGHRPLMWTFPFWSGCSSA